MKMIILWSYREDGQRNKEQFLFHSKQCDNFTHDRKSRLEKLLQTGTLEAARLDLNLGFQFTNDVE